MFDSKHIDFPNFTDKLYLSEQLIESKFLKYELQITRFKDYKTATGFIQNKSEGTRLKSRANSLKSPKYHVEVVFLYSEIT